MKKLILAVVLMFSLALPSVVAALSYQDGGPEKEDPCPSGGKCFYVDGNNGNDNNPGTKAKPWKSLTKVSKSTSSFSGGAHILFKRGTTIGGSTIRTSGVQGTENKRLVYGAYGSLSSPKPKLRNTARSIFKVEKLKYVTFRDLDSQAITIEESDYVLVYNNKIGDSKTNVLFFGDKTNYNVIARNHIGSADSNDGISIHDITWDEYSSNNRGFPGSHWWIIDNVCEGSNGMEECLDIATHGPGGDYKIIGNRFAARSSKGSAGKPLIIGYDSHSTWIIGNTMNAGAAQGMLIGSSQLEGTRNSTLTGIVPHYQISGNIIWGDPTKARPVAYLYRLRDSTVEHNTFLNSVNDIWGESLLIKSDRGGTYRKNIVNERNSINPPSGMSIPGSGFNNPANWNSNSFLSKFTPSSSWSGCKGFGNTDGAFDCDGNRQGMVMKEQDPKVRLGWSGMPIVKEIMADLGVTTQGTFKDGSSGDDSGTFSSCRILTRDDTVPQGYGSAYDVAGTGIQTVRTKCHQNDVKILVGEEDPNLLVYHKGYVWKNGAWKEFTLNGEATSSSSWLRGITTTVEEGFNMNQDNYVLGYFCRWTGTKWKCGCRDSTCSQNYWNLQTFPKR